MCKGTAGWGRLGDAEGDGAGMHAWLRNPILDDAGDLEAPTLYSSLELWIGCGLGGVGIIIQDTTRDSKVSSPNLLLSNLNK